jgi:hypothetical protein
LGTKVQDKNVFRHAAKITEAPKTRRLQSVVRRNIVRSEAYFPYGDSNANTALRLK